MNRLVPPLAVEQNGFALIAVMISTTILAARGGDRSLWRGFDVISRHDENWNAAWPPPRPA